MEIGYLFVGTVVVLLLVQLVVLRLRLRAQEREFAEFKRSMVVVPIPKKKQSPWIAVFAVSTLILALAVFVMALR